MKPQTSKEAQVVIDWDAPVEKPAKIEIDEMVYYKYRYNYNMVSCCDCVYGYKGNKDCSLGSVGNGCCLGHGEVNPEIIEAVEKYWNTRNGG